MTRQAHLIGAMAGVLMATAGAPALADEVVLATTGGLMRNMMEEYMYLPFEDETGTTVIPFDIEVPDQWARAEGMMRTKNVEFDIVTATGPDLVGRTDMLMDIPCDKLENVKEFGLKGACQPKGVARTTGGMVLAYNKDAFDGKAPQNWADFWDTETFPGPRGLPDTGDKDWWVPAVALLADGVKKEDLFPLDLDRAYKKLDEIRPKIAVWWKTGNQVQQIMRDNEVVMTMSYSGRALATIKEGAPFAMAWDGAIRDTGYFSILKDAPNAEGALKFIDFFYGNSEGQPKFISAVGYATSTSNGLTKLPEDEQKLYATYPANYEVLVDPDFKWIGDNRDMLRERWTAWLAQ
ncbi:extracellular solute-binding protein [Jiella pelagia]|uniref:Extracellular solute-binding protein n=1 Tax=Jiella pelagia TaxID=2986949 RepID=A0ABY7BW44_9HYPH|nr:extracellular solute-binding protein [Jiella pelagia]WAP67617.1 extracellular solute-binding protein [Jiella pelagia]